VPQKLMESFGRCAGVSGTASIKTGEDRATQVDNGGCN
jgi:hypothetical protein